MRLLKKKKIAIKKTGEVPASGDEGATGRKGVWRGGKKREGGRRVSRNGNGGKILQGERLAGGERWEPAGEGGGKEGLGKMLFIPAKGKGIEGHAPSGKEKKNRGWERRLRGKPVTKKKKEKEGGDPPGAAPNVHPGQGKETVGVGEK